jgi:hypothetical protein
MNEILNTDWPNNDNSDWISNTEFIKWKRLKYYNSFNNIDQTKLINNGNKEFYCKKWN